MPNILITGGTGKTGRRVADRLRALGARPRVATRQPNGDGQVRFDWNDPASFADAFDGVAAVYLVAPTGAGDALGAMRPGLDHALAAGVETFVLLSASALEEGGPMMGTVHRYLRERAPRWIALRPTWFMQNFSEGQHLPTIRDERVVYSATGDGRVPFIDAADIAAVAAAALTDRGLESGELVLTGPRTLSYADVAAALSDAIGVAIAHRRLDEAEMVERFRGMGMDDGYARALAGMDAAIAAGGEDRVTDTVARITGRSPGSFARFAAENRACWV